MSIRVIFVVMFIVMFAPVIAVAGNVVIIANQSVTTSNLSKKDVRKIFLGKKITWGDETKIHIVFQKNSNTHKAFLKNYIHKNPSRFAGYWKRQIFTGQVLAPRTLEGDQEIIKFVGETQGAIGYVSAGSNLKNVKTISVE